MEGVCFNLGADTSNFVRMQSLEGLELNTGRVEALQTGSALSRRKSAIKEDCYSAI